MFLAISKTLEILGECLSVAAFAATPCLAIFAYLAWSKHLRKELPYWRNILGMISILATFSSWLTFLGDFVLIVLRSRTHVDFAVWLYGEILMLVIGLPLAFALKRPARTQALLANLCMVFVLANSVVF